MRVGVPDTQPQAGAAEGAEAEGRGAGGVPVGVRDEFGGQQFGGVVELGQTMSGEDGPEGDSGDARGESVVRQLEGVRPRCGRIGLRRGYGDHERLLRWGDLGSLYWPGWAVACRVRADGLRGALPAYRWGQLGGLGLTVDCGC